MKKTLYQDAKKHLSRFAEDIKSRSNDNGLICLLLNNELDTLIRLINREVLNERLSKKRAQQVINWLDNFNCTLHPKD